MSTKAVRARDFRIRAAKTCRDQGLALHKLATDAAKRYEAATTKSQKAYWLEVFDELASAAKASALIASRIIKKKVVFAVQ